MTTIRVDHVGSLLRPEDLKAAFMRHATNQMTREELNAAQDEAIRVLIAKEEATACRWSPTANTGGSTGR